jgi:hypothetical protein
MVRALDVRSYLKRSRNRSMGYKNHIHSHAELSTLAERGGLGIPGEAVVLFSNVEQGSVSDKGLEASSGIDPGVAGRKQQSLLARG